LFLDATTDTLVRRYSETRRKHPLSQSDLMPGQPDARRALVDAIELERELLAALREQAHVIDSSMIRPAQLQGYVEALVSTPGNALTLVFESFAFKRGVPNRCRLHVRRAHAPQPTLRTRAQKFDRPGCAGGGVPAGATGRTTHAATHRRVHCCLVT